MRGRGRALPTMPRNGSGTRLFRADTRPRAHLVFEAVRCRRKLDEFPRRIGVGTRCEMAKPHPPSEADGIPPSPSTIGTKPTFPFTGESLRVTCET